MHRGLTSWMQTAGDSISDDEILDLFILLLKLPP